MLSRTVEQNDGYLLLETLLTFNRIKATRRIAGYLSIPLDFLRQRLSLPHEPPQALGVTDRGQLVEAAGKSEMLELDSEATKVRRAQGS